MRSDLECLSNINLQNANLPEDSEGDENTVTFVSNMLFKIMSKDVFDNTPALARAHRVGQTPKAGRPP